MMDLEVVVADCISLGFGFNYMIEKHIHATFDPRGIHGDFSLHFPDFKNTNKLITHSIGNFYRVFVR
jgi:hypothetical protein